MTSARDIWNSVQPMCRRKHRYPRRWFYSKKRRFRSRFCKRCCWQEWQERRGTKYVNPDSSGEGKTL